MSPQPFGRTGPPTDDSDDLDESCVCGDLYTCWMVDPGRWVRTQRGFLRIPPPACPACGWGWPLTGPYRPREGSVFCRCTPDRTHTLWTCTCGALVAEGCQDVMGWGRASVPAGLADELRWAC